MLTCHRCKANSPASFLALLPNANDAEKFILLPVCSKCLAELQGEVIDYSSAIGAWMEEGEK